MFYSFSHFLFLIKSTKKFNFESKIKDQKIKLVCESIFRYFWEKNELCITYDTSWNQGHIQGKVKQWNTWERSIFLKEIKILLLVCNIKRVNLWKTVLIIPVYRYSTLVLRLLYAKNFPQQNFTSSPLGEYSLPLNDIWKTLPVATYDENFVKHS